jgi:hypothetical protein
VFADSRHLKRLTPTHVKGAVMKKFVALFVAALLSACATSAVDQTPQINQTTQAVEQAYALCKSAVDASPEAMRLSEAFVLGNNKNNNYLEKTANTSYATDKQVSDIHSYHADLKICRDQAVKDLQAFDEKYAKLVSDYFTANDKITAAVVNKKITIGEANKKVTKSEYAYSLKGYDLKN